MTALTAKGSTRRWRRLRALVLIRDGQRCQLPVSSNGTHVLDDDPDGIDETGKVRVCGHLASHVDHKIPRVFGGDDSLDNLRAACAQGNLERGTGTTDQRPRRQRPRWSW